MASQMLVQDSPSSSNLWPIILFDTKGNSNAALKLTTTIPVRPSMLIRHVAVMITTESRTELELRDVAVFADGKCQKNCHF